MEATRETPKKYRCRCLIIHPNNVHDWCGMFTPGPDQPFCPSCEDRHPERGSDQTVTAIIPQRVT